MSVQRAKEKEMEEVTAKITQNLIVRTLVNEEVNVRTLVNEGLSQ